MGAVNWYTKQSLMTQIIIAIIVVIVIIIIVRKVKIYLKKANAEKQFQNFQQSGTDGNGQPYTFNGATVAAKVYDAFYNYWGGMAEDEEAAINAIRNVPHAFIPTVADAYYKLYSHVLHEDFVKYLEDDDYAKVADLFQ